MPLIAKPAAGSTGRTSRRSPNEAGVAMITALAVVAITGLLAVVAVQLSFHSETATAKDRERIVATSAAEGGVDVATAAMKGAVSLPCTLTGTIPTTPKASSYTVAISYYDSYPPTGAPLACDTTTGKVIGNPKAALIQSDGKLDGPTGKIKRRMESLVKINVIPGNGFDKAVYSDAGLAIANSTHVMGNAGNDADIYTNDPDVACGNSIEIAGSILSQGNVVVNNSCKIAVDVWAKGNVSMANSASVGFDVKSSRGAITAANTSKIGRDAIAFGTITGAAIGTGNPVRNKVPNATIPDPPYVPLPSITFDSAAWTSAGYTVVTNNNCATINATITGLASATQKTVVTTDCKIDFGTTTTINLTKSVAIFAKGGFSFRNTTTWKNLVTPTVTQLHLIVPTGSTCTAYANPNNSGLGNILVGNSSEFPDMDVFFYTPCQFKGLNSTHFDGQVYGKDVEIVNSYEMKFVPLPVWGASGGGGSSTYSAEVVYKREDVAGS